MLSPPSSRPDKPGTLDKFEKEHRIALLQIARQAIILAVQSFEPLIIQPPEGVLAERAGAFVTLRRAGRLRGCVGQIDPIDALVNVVAHCAMSAALADPRFEPLRPADLPPIEIEISVLSAPKPIRPEEIECGTHGLMVVNGTKRSVLLPQVAFDYRWSAERFLTETCLKGGMVSDAWKAPATSVYGFTAEVFSEREFALHPAHSG